MLLQLQFQITYTNGDTATVRSRPSTEVAFERRFNVTVASLFVTAPFDKADDVAAMAKWFGDNMRSEHTYFLAWHSARAGAEFDDWLDTVETIDWTFAGTADPTQPAPPAA